MIEYYYGEHALDQIHERLIETTWVDRTLRNPDHVELLEKKNKIYYYARIKEFGNRYLKVVVNIRSKPYKIATIHFDRRIGKRI